MSNNILSKNNNKNLKETDFDGHTGFDLMTFEEKLRWLSEAAESIHIIKSNNKKKTVFKC